MLRRARDVTLGEQRLERDQQIEVDRCQIHAVENAYRDHPFPIGKRPREDRVLFTGGLIMSANRDLDSACPELAAVRTRIVCMQLAPSDAEVRSKQCASTWRIAPAS